MKFLNYFFDHFLNKKKIHYIDKEIELSDVVDRLTNEENISIDTEFLWRDTYFPKLSLIQMGSPREIFILDSLKIPLEKLNILTRIFKNKNILKVFHSCRGDIAALSTIEGLSFENIFDTQIAHSIISSEGGQISYKDLVRKLFLKSISKSMTTSDWSKRPLQSSQLDYAANDVKYLLEIKRYQFKKLKSLKLMDFAHAEMQKELNIAQSSFTHARYERFLKNNKNSSKVIKELFLWREDQALKKNVPPNKIFKEKYLKKLNDAVLSKKYKECEWIISDEEIRKNFFRNFK